MSKELVVSSSRHETRVAILDDDQLVEIFHEREKEYSLAGSIHKGRVTRVLPGMQSAFVDIGLDRDAFLYVSDFFEDNEEYDAVVTTVEEKVLKMEKGGGRPEPIAETPAEAPLDGSSTSGEAAVDEASDAVTASPAGENSPEQLARAPHSADRGPRGDRPGGDRGDRGDRRGRRGRRRRGGRGPGNLPESKFYSPAAAQHDGEAAVEFTGAAEEAELLSLPPVNAPEIDEEFMVLPGESLAKYAVADAREDDEPAEDEVRQPLAEAAEEFGASVAAEPEPAIPAEHPLAGLGDVSSWVAASEPEAVPAEVIHEETVPHEEAFHEESPAVEHAAAEPVIATADDLPEELQETAEAEAISEESKIEDEPGAASEEGPEPARIPTSLTATLREQGHRYPHRVSRRMRRKMRGGQGEERGDRGGRDRGERGERQPAPAEAKTVETSENPATDSRPEPGSRRERSDRERGRDRSERTERGERDRSDRPPLPSISDLLKEGQEIIVQIAKEPLGQKGARITSHIALPGRFVVYMPTVDHAGVSRKIPSEEERHRLKRVLQTHRQGIPGGFICRTAAENKSEEDLRSDMHFLYNLWLDMRQKAEKKPAPVLLHHDLDLVQRILRDQLTTSFKTIWVDNEELYESILRFVERFQPALIGRVKLYTRANPIFDEFGVTNELEKALRPKVWLKSGGYIVINQTEALVAIDINTGKYVGKSNRLEDTIVKINTDAIREIVRQIRVRDLGGIIVVDFIDMDERRNRAKVMQALEDAMRADRAPYKILQFNDFGLVAITRKRVKQSLERTLCAPCPYCEGAGSVKSVQTVIGEIIQEAQRMHKALEDQHSNIVLRVNPEVARVLKSNQNRFLQEIEEILGKSVLVKSDPLLHQTKFDLA